MTSHPARVAGPPQVWRAAATRHPGRLPGALLTAAVAWAVAASGGTRPVDLVLATTLAAAALSLTGVRPADLRGAASSPLGLALVALLAWTAVVGLTSTRDPVVALWMPCLLALSALAAAAADRLDAGGRAVALDGLVVVGALLACSAVLDWVGGVLDGEQLPVRAATLTGYPNVAGVLLVATGSVTLHLHRKGRLGGRSTAGLVTLQTLGVLATGSRLALLLTLAAVVIVAGQRRTRAGVLAGTAVALPVVALLAQRFATGSTERLRLWSEAVSQIAAHPVTGRGPTPVVLAASLGGKPTTHAHDEVLQLGMEYGVVGLGLSLLVLALVARSLRARRLVDPLLALACVAVASLALTDFALRTTAAALVLAVLVPLTWRPATEPSTGRGI